MADAFPMIVRWPRALLDCRHVQYYTSTVRVFVHNALSNDAGMNGDKGVTGVWSILLFFYTFPLHLPSTK